MFKPLILAALLAPGCAVAQQALLSLDDPAGDDNGNGALIHPQRADLQPGDLDLRSLRVFRESNGLRFEATFQNPIRDPAKVSSDVGSNESLSVFARRGFYAFNIDVYIDTDRVAGSGNVATLPGRGATIDPAHAWDKVIVLTPRPELMRRQLQEALIEAAGKGAGDIAPTMERSVFFATEVRARGKTVSFFVPDSFIGATPPTDWSVVAFVTAAKVYVESDFRLFGANNTTLMQRLALGVLPPAEGRPTDTFGYRGDAPPPTAVVDLLGPAGTQARQLSAGSRLEGVDRRTPVAAAAAAAPVTAAAPSPTSAQQSGSIFSRALDALTGLLGGRSAAADAAPAAAPVAAPTMQTLLQSGATPATAPPAAASTAAPSSSTPARAASAAPAAPVAAVPAPVAAPAPPRPAAADAGKPRDAAFFEEQELRLRTLKRLRDSGLISEEEYQQKRKEVLDRI